jgi:hypothetical protein
LKCNLYRYAALQKRWNSESKEKAKRKRTRVGGGEGDGDGDDVGSVRNCVVAHPCQQSQSHTGRVWTLQNPKP